VLLAKIPFGQQQLLEQDVLMNRISAEQTVFDPRLLAREPSRLERITQRVHGSRRRKGSLVV
jgi:hypothetical protein